MSEMDEEMKAGQIFELTDDEGNTFTFELLDFVVVEEMLYAVLSTVDEEADEDDEEELNVVIMQTEFEGKDPVFTLVEDEEICKNVLETFMDSFDDEEEVEIETDEE